MGEETKMDASRLISEVYKRPALWNQRHISYHNRDVTNRIWMEMAALFKLPKQVLKTKWKGLRDTFRAEIKKDEVYRKSNYTQNRPVWIHFETLQFLKEQMLPRPPIWERSDSLRVSDAPTATTEQANDNHSSMTPTTTTTTTTTTIVARDNNRRVSKRLCSQQHRIETPRRRDSSMGPRNDEGRVVEITVQANIVKDDRPPGACSANKSCHRHFSRIHRHINKNNRSNNDTNKDSGSGKPEKTVKQEPLDDCENNLETIVGNSHGINNDNEISIQDVSMAVETSATPEMNNHIGLTVGQLADPPENNRFDDNYYFFMSLLPHIRSLPADRRMLLRLQMQQLVYQEVYNRTTRSSSTSFCSLPTT